MFPATAVTLGVLAIVLAVLLTRYATFYFPESPVRLWATRLAVVAIALWLASGLIQEIRNYHNFFDFVYSRRFIRAAFAIVFVWAVFDDDL